MNEVDCIVQDKQLHCSSDEDLANGVKSADANDRDATQSTEVKDYQSGSLLHTDTPRVASIFNKNLKCAL